MAQITPEVKEAIQIAIQLEKDGRRFFEKAAEETKNELGKKMFLKLASDEVRHLVTFEKMFKSIADPRTWKELLKEGPPEERMPYFSEKAESRSPVEKGAGEVEALRQALEVERKAIDFFKEVAKQASDPEASRIFEIIAQEEITHYDLIQAQIDSVTNAGFWFDVGEFKMDGLY